MSGVQETSTSLDIGQNVFNELANRLERFVLSDEIQLGRIRGIGGYADVYEAKMRTAEGSVWKRIAVKRFRTMLENDEKFAKSLKREVLIWKTLDHENILSFLGIAFIDGIPCTLSEWMENGTMVTYLNSHVDVDIQAMVHGIACGLEYLHNHQVVHSDLKGDNVLIADDGRPVLADFGISRLLVDSVTIAGTTTLRGNARWMAPELIEAPAGSPNQMHTKATDVWAFGMVFYQALCGKVPFHDFSNEFQVMMAIINKQLPVQPKGPVCDRGQFNLLWSCCRECWSHDATGRPTMSTMRTRLEVRQLEVEQPEVTKYTFAIEMISNLTANGCWMSPKGLFLATTDDYKTISFLDSKTMARHGPGLKVDSRIHGVVWSPTEEYIVTSSRDGILRKWGDVFETPRIIAQSAQKYSGAKLEFSPDDRAIASQSSLTVWLWDASNLSLIWRTSGIWPSVTFHPSGNRVVFFAGSKLLDVNIEDLKKITATRREPAQIYHLYRLVFDPSGNSNICVAKTSQGVQILNADTFEKKSSLPLVYNCSAMQITPDGKYIVLIQSKKVVLWDIIASKAIEELNLAADLFLWANVATNCRVVWLRDDNISRFVHLTSIHC